MLHHLERRNHRRQRIAKFVRHHRQHVIFAAVRRFCFCSRLPFGFDESCPLRGQGGEAFRLILETAPREVQPFDNRARQRANQQEGAQSHRLLGIADVKRVDGR